MKNDNTFEGLGPEEIEEYNKLLQTKLGEATDDQIRKVQQYTKKTIQASLKRIKRQTRNW